MNKRASAWTYRVPAEGCNRPSSSFPTSMRIRIPSCSSTSRMAHLEIFRQRQTYQLLAEVAANQRSQIIAASHSEVVLAEAAGRGKVIAFVGRPHTMNDRGAQVIKALTTIGWDQYYQAEQSGWVLYLEGASDLAILQTFARTLEHPALPALERPFVFYVSTNLPNRARSLLRAARREGQLARDCHFRPFGSRSSTRKSVGRAHVEPSRNRELLLHRRSPDGLRAIQPNRRFVRVG